ncbi:MAG: hypothetical protein ACFFER_07260 [Candidatus Thorarchaeota archaeon]
MNFSYFSCPVLVLVNIIDTWFVFNECAFVSSPLYPALGVYGIANGVFSSCIFFGSVYYNSSTNCAFHHSLVLKPVQAFGSTESIFHSNVFDEDADVFVDSLVRPSYNVSFFENEFLGEFHLADVSDCYIINNIFLQSPIDDGSDNIWDENEYYDYDGVGSYQVSRLAGSVDAKPFGRQDDTSFPSPNGIPNGDTDLASLFVVIIFVELVVIALILSIRRKPFQ